jgi:membrane fusion protein (multidrug efflux system)
LTNRNQCRRWVGRLGKLGWLAGCVLLLPISLVFAQPGQSMPSGKAVGEVICLIEPSMEASVGTPVDGVLEVVNVDRGDLVVVGQLLAKLNSGVELAAVDFQTVKSEFGGRKLNRNGEMLTKKLISEHELDEISTEQKLSELELRQRKEMLRLRSIVSPIKGVVVDRYRNRGDLVKQEKIFRIAQIDPLHVETIVPANMFGRVKIGQVYEIKPQLSAGFLKARVSNVDQVIDPASSTFRVRLVLPNPRYEIPSGQRCSANF